MFAASSMGKEFRKRLMLIFLLLTADGPLYSKKTINRVVSEAIKFS